VPNWNEGKNGGCTMTKYNINSHPESEKNGYMVTPEIEEHWMFGSILIIDPFLKMGRERRLVLGRSELLILGKVSNTTRMIKTLKRFNGGDFLFVCKCTDEIMLGY